MNKNPDYIAVASNLIEERFPDAACAFVAGSIVTGHGTPSSDIDLIVFYTDETRESYRDSIIYEGWPVEIFVHNPKSQDYFMAQDLDNGQCSTLTMVITGIVIGNEAVAQSRKDKAASLMAQGPNPWTKEKIDNKRYFLSDLLDDLHHPKDPDYVPAILAEIFIRLGDFYLRAQNEWSGDGKQLIKIMKKNHAEFAHRYLRAFEKAQQNDIQPLEDLMQEVLSPYGGFLFEGYKSVVKL